MSEPMSVSSRIFSGTPTFNPLAVRRAHAGHSTGDVRRDAISPPPGDRWATAAALTETVRDEPPGHAGVPPVRRDPGPGFVSVPNNSAGPGSSPGGGPRARRYSRYLDGGRMLR